MAAFKKVNPNSIFTVKPADCSAVIPHPRSGHRCVADEENLYCFGGYSPHYHDRVFSELWRFNFSTKTWHNIQTRGPFPFGVASGCVIVDKGNLIVFGGANDPAMSDSSEVSICSLRKQEWTAIPNVADFKPPGVYGHSLVLSPDRDLYVFAGFNGISGFTSDLFSFSLSRCKFVDLSDRPNAPPPRYRHEAVSDREKFFVIGGGNHSFTAPSGMYDLTQVYSFHYEQKRWQEHPCQPCPTHGFPKPRRCHSCVILGLFVFLCGGYDGELIFDDIWKLNLQTFKWTKLSKVMPYPVYFHSAAVTPAGCLYVFGGSKGLEDEAQRSNEVHKLWLNVPPLLEICWEKITDFVPRIQELRPGRLAELGIPLFLIARLR